MIGMIEFMEQPTEEQWIYFWQYAVYLCEKRTWNESFMLYSLHDFYVEIIFDPIRGNAKSIEAFKENQRLDKYVDITEYGD